MLGGTKWQYWRIMVELDDQWHRNDGYGCSNKVHTKDIGIWSISLGLNGWGQNMWGRGLNEITLVQSQSLVWSSILQETNYTNKCATCGPNYTITWKGIGSIHSSQNIYDIIKLPTNKDPIAEEVGICPLSKIIVCLWRLRWNQFYQENGKCKYQITVCYARRQMNLLTTYT